MSGDGSLPDAAPLDAVVVVPGDEIFVDHEGGFLKCAASACALPLRLTTPRS